MQRKTVAYPKPFSFVTQLEHRHSPLKDERYLYSLKQCNSLGSIGLVIPKD